MCRFCAALLICKLFFPSYIVIENSEVLFALTFKSFHITDLFWHLALAKLFKTLILQTMFHCRSSMKTLHNTLNKLIKNFQTLNATPSPSLTPFHSLPQLLYQFPLCHVRILRLDAFCTYPHHRLSHVNSHHHLHLIRQPPQPLATLLIRLHAKHAPLQTIEYSCNPYKNLKPQLPN